MFLTLFPARNDLLQEVHSESIRIAKIGSHFDAEEVEALLLRSILGSEGLGRYPLRHH